MRIVTSGGVRGHSLSSQCQQGTADKSFRAFAGKNRFKTF